MTRPWWSIVMRLGTSIPRSRVPAPLFSSASSNSGWVVMPAPRPTSSTGERSNTSTSQPIRRRNAAVNRPDIEPPTMTARRLRRFDKLAIRYPRTWRGDDSRQVSVKPPGEQGHADRSRGRNDAEGDAAVSPLGCEMEQPRAGVLRDDLQGSDQYGERRRLRRQQALDRIGHHHPAGEGGEVADEIGAHSERVAGAAKPVDDDRRSVDLHGPAHQARKQADPDGDEQNRPPMIAPAGGQHGDHRKHDDGDAPAQRNRIRVLQDEGAELSGDQRRGRQRHDLAPHRLAPER